MNKVILCKGNAGMRFYTLSINPRIRKFGSSKTSMPSQKFRTLGHTNAIWHDGFTITRDQAIFPRQNWQRSFRNDGTIWGWGSVDEGRHVTQNSGFIGNKANEIWVVIRSSAIFWILERVSPIIHYHSLEKLTNYAYTTTNFWGMRYSSKLSENLWAEVSMKVTLDQISVDIRY